MGLFGRKGIFDSTKTVHTTDAYRSAGRPIVCPHCGHDRFDQGSALLNTPGMTFFGLDWANRSATVLCCRQCSRIQWFLHEPEETIGA